MTRAAHSAADPARGTGGKRRLGVPDGRFRIPGDFNRPLPDDVLRAFEDDGRLADYGDVVKVV